MCLAITATFCWTFQVSASIRDTLVDGIDGLNINLEAPFNFQDYVVGFKYALGNLRRLPESIFARKTFETPVNGKLHVDADYAIEKNTAHLSRTWSSETLDLAVGVAGDSKDFVTSVSANKRVVVAGNPLSLSGQYLLASKTAVGRAVYSVGKTVVAVTGDSTSLDPVVAVSRVLDAQNEVTPSISLKTGTMSYAWRRRWGGGSLLTTVHPNAANKRVELEWSDVGTNGVWTTRAEVPLDDSSKVKISVSRDWKQ